MLFRMHPSVFVPFRTCTLSPSDQTRRRRRGRGGEAIAVHVIKDDGLSATSSDHDVIDGVGEFMHGCLGMTRESRRIGGGCHIC